MMDFGDSKATCFDMQQWRVLQAAGSSVLRRAVVPPPLLGKKRERGRRRNIVEQIDHKKHVSRRYLQTEQSNKSFPSTMVNRNAIPRN